MGQRRLAPQTLGKVVRLYGDGLSMAQVGSRLGLSIGAVHYRLRVAGVARRTRADYRQRLRSPEELKAIADMYLGGLSLRRVAARVGMSSESVRQALKRAGVGRRSSSDYRRSYLPQSELECVARLYGSGMSAAHIGRTLSITGNRVIYRLQKLGVPVRPAGHYGAVSREEMKRTAELYAGGMPGLAVARRLSISLPAVYARLRRMGVPRRPRGTRTAAW